MSEEVEASAATPVVQLPLGQDPQQGGLPRVHVSQDRHPQVQELAPPDRDDTARNTTSNTAGVRHTIHYITTIYTTLLLYVHYITTIDILNNYYIYYITTIYTSNYYIHYYYIYYITTIYCILHYYYIHNYYHIYITTIYTNYYHIYYVTNKHTTL